MKKSFIYSFILLLLMTGCTAESLKEQEVAQEKRFEDYINSLISTGAVKSDSVFYLNGVYRIVLISGVGDVAAATDSIIFRYEAMNFNTGLLFDSTGQRPEKGILGIGHYIEGLEKGLSGMKSNENALILLTGEHAYGNMGMGMLPPNTAVMFNVLMERVIKNN